MISVKTFRQMTLSFEDTLEQSHFEKASFRVKKKIFVTLDEPNHRICVKLSPVNQSIFCLIDKNIIWAVPNKWGQQGWTFVNLKKVKKEILKDVLIAAYCEVAPATLAALYQKSV